MYIKTVDGALPLLFRHFLLAVSLALTAYAVFSNPFSPHSRVSSSPMIRVI